MSDNNMIKENNSENNSIFNSCIEYIKSHPLYAVATAFVLVLSYGFYATKYTFNLDQLVPEYYDSTLLITAGRFAAPFIHLFTNWMDFSPFWHTMLMMLFFWISGLCWIVLFNKAADGNISNKALFSFWLIYPIYPMISEQLTFPILNIALAYILIPIALWILYPYIFNSVTPPPAKILLSFVLVVSSIDMYESFAPVFLTGFFAILIIKFIFSDFKTFADIFKSSCKVFIFLIISIIIDYFASKLICYVFSGTTEFWYSNNQTIKWELNSIFDSAIWFLRDWLSHYVIMSSVSLSVFIFDLFSILGIIIFIIVSKKEHSFLPVLLFLGLFISSVSLSIIICGSPLYRMEQALPVYVAFLWMIINEFNKDKKIFKKIITVCTVLLIMVESQSINNFSVRNYEIFNYEYNTFRQLGENLKKNDISHKSVAFIKNVENIFTNCYSIPMESTHPICLSFKRLSCKFWDAVLPEKYFESMNTVIWWKNHEITNCDSLIQSIGIKTTLYTNYIELSGIGGYNALKRMGYDLIQCTKEQYEEAQKYLVPDDTSVDFLITETDSMIIVQLMPAQ